MSERPVEIYTNRKFFELNGKDVLRIVTNVMKKHDAQELNAFGYFRKCGEDVVGITISKKPELMEPSIFDTGRVISIAQGIVNKDWKVKTKDEKYKDLSFDIRKGILDEKNKREKYYSDVNKEMESLRQYINKNIKESGHTGLEEMEVRIDSYLKSHR